MRILPLTLFLGCAAAGAVFSACGSEDGAAAPNDAGADGASADGTSGGSPSCAAIAEAQCRRGERCSPLLTHALIGDLAECKERLTLVCERATHAPGATPYTAACLAALESPSCETDDGAACRSTGTLADGAPCEFPGQCQAGHCAGVGGSEFCGTCKPAGSGFDPAGAACENDDCDRGLSCIGFASPPGGERTPGKCEPTRTLGQECTDTEDCNPGGRCGGDSCLLGYGVACIDGRCAAPLGEGAKCPLSLNGPVCDVRQELLCQLGSGGSTCVKIVFGAENAPCKRTEGPAPGTCIGSTRCVGDAGAQTCIRKPAEGEPCTDDDECRLGAACLGGVCTIAPADRCK